MREGVVQHRCPVSLWQRLAWNFAKARGMQPVAASGPGGPGASPRANDKFYSGRRGDWGRVSVDSGDPDVVITVRAARGSGATVSLHTQRQRKGALRFEVDDKEVYDYDVAVRLFGKDASG